MLRQGLTVTAGGIVAGMLLSLAMTRWIASLLYGVSATDLVTYASVPVLLGAVALLATYIPALRATRVDPLTAIRAE